MTPGESEVSVHTCQITQKGMGDEPVSHHLSPLKENELGMEGAQNPLCG